MQIDGVNLKTVVFPGEAGDLQRRRATASLVRVLGDDYARYHDFLANKLAALGPDPDPDPRDYLGDFEAYAAACTRLVDLLRAEKLLRRCRELRTGAGSAGVPLVDERYRLVSAMDWQPPETPVEVPVESSPRGDMEVPHE